MSNEKTDKKFSFSPERIVFLIIIVLVAALFINAVLSAVGIGFSYDTTLARIETVNVTGNYRGYVIRSESAIEQDSDEKSIAVVPEGTKIEAGGEVARKVNSSDYSGYVAELETIQEKLDYLNSIKTNVDAYKSNIAVYNQNILKSVYRYAEAVADGNYDDIRSASFSVGQYLSVKQMILGETIDIEDQIAACNAEYESVRSQIIANENKSVKTERSGYYFSYVDGCETLVPFNTVKELTSSEIDSLVQMSGTERPNICKMVYDSRWYFVCVMPVFDAQKLSYFSEYNVTFRDSSAGTIKMRVDALNEDQDSGTVAVIFSSKTMNEAIASLRIVSADICFESFTGLSVPKSAIRTAERDGTDVTGVYVKFNNIAKFREIKILYENDNICIVEHDPDNNTGQYLRLNDAIFTEGVGFNDEHIIRDGYFS